MQTHLTHSCDKIILIIVIIINTAVVLLLYVFACL